jgi:hypothetical protein
MVKLALKVLLAGAALWAVWAFVPVAGRTLQERWSRAPSATAFAEKAWADLTGKGPAPAAGKARPPTHAQRRAEDAPAGRDRPAERPVERHSDADRRAVDRILSEHLSESR